MTDLEMTRLCAEAMGYECIDGLWLDEMRFGPGRYDPLHDDAQAMALVKKLGLWIIQPDGRSETEMVAYLGSKRIGTQEDLICGKHPTDLNRSIVECVAKMQKAK